MISLSIGISLYPENGLDSESMYKSADIAMYKSKQSGKGKYSFFSSGMDIKIEKRQFIENLMYESFQDNKITYHVQPIFQDGKCKIVEMLMRLRDKNGVYISPAEFIPIAEKNRYINVLGDWIINEGFILSKTISNDIKVSINISIVQLTQDNFLDKIEEMILINKVDPSQIILELTESVYLDHTFDIINKISSLITLGFNLAIDDFGVGYSSFERITQYDIKYIKIDKYFTDIAREDKKYKLLIKNLVHMFNAIGMEVIVEGVENISSHNELSTIRDIYLQGFYYEKPLAFSEFTKKDYFKSKMEPIK